jgi:hypothetical protein
MNFVAQRGEYDCVQAALATVCAHPYEYVFKHFAHGFAHGDRAVYDHEACWYLLIHGFQVEIRRGYARPFAPRHLMVLRDVVGGERGGYSHYVVVLADGRVLDPASESGYSMGGYPRRWEDYGKYVSPVVEFVIGIWPPKGVDRALRRVDSLPPAA